MNATYVILGATGGVGRALTDKLLSQKNTVIASGRNLEKLSQIQAKYPNISTQVIDATQSEQVEQLIADTLNKYQKLDGIVNCVGSVFLKPAHLTTDSEWFETLNTNLGSAFATVKAAGKYMKTGGSVVLLSSGASLIGIPNHEAIAAAKGGINSLVLSAAATYASRNLRFNAVAPGMVSTQATSKIINNPTALKASISNHPLGRIGQPEEIASLIAWLIDPNNSWITGQVIAIDGGLSTLRSRVSI